jgi:hypothetical protein
MSVPLLLHCILRPHAWRVLYWPRRYRYGTTTLQALRTLYKEGGIPRFYQGMIPALVQGPLSRFGDTAANTGVLAVLEEVDLPPAAKTVAASLGAGLFRIFLMPVDALKTMMQVRVQRGIAQPNVCAPASSANFLSWLLPIQVHAAICCSTSDARAAHMKAQVEGKNGIPALMAKVQKGGPSVLYHGALAASAATFVGHYPWFAGTGMHGALADASFVAALLGGSSPPATSRVLCLTPRSQCTTR